MSDEPAGARGATEITEPGRGRAQLARRIAESRATVPDLTLSVDADLEAALTAQPDAAPVDLVIAAAAAALRAFPQVNASYRDARFESYARVNVAVLLDVPDGTATPTIFDADTLSVPEIAAQRTALEARVRDGEAIAPEVRGSTFTVVDVSGRGIRRLVPVVAQPQAATLAIGALAPRAVVVDGQLAVRRTLDLTLACDGRILGVELAADFLAAIAASLTSAA